MSEMCDHHDTGTGGCGSPKQQSESKSRAPGRSFFFFDFLKEFFLELFCRGKFFDNINIVFLHIFKHFINFILIHDSAPFQFFIQHFFRTADPPIQGIDITVLQAGSIFARQSAEKGRRQGITEFMREFCDRPGQGFDP